MIPHIDSNSGFSALSNALTGTGSTGDPVSAVSLNSSVSKLLDQDRAVLEHFYSNVWLCAKVVDYYPILMASIWGTPLVSEGEVDPTISQYAFALAQVFQRGQQAANLYGGACVIRFTDDSDDWSEPLNPAKCSVIEYSRVYDKWEIYPDPVYTVTATDMYNPEYYVYSPINATTEMEQLEGTHKRIHKSRILRFRGRYLPPNLFMENNYWESSLLGCFIEPFLRWATAQDSLANSLKGFNATVLKVQDLTEKSILEIDRGASSTSFASRVSNILTQLSANKGIVLDAAEEDLIFPSRTYTNIAPILDQLKEAMIAASGLTKPQLFQEHPVGLAATGQSERLAESRMLTSLMKSSWSKLIKNEMTVCAAVYTPNKDSQELEWEWTNPNEETREERTTRLRLIADLDKTYIELGVYSPEEVRISRFSGAMFGEEINLQSDTLPIAQKTDSSDNPQEDNPRLETTGEVWSESDYISFLDEDNLAALSDEDFDV